MVGGNGQLDLPPLKPFYVAGWSRLELGAAQWANSVSLFKVVNNGPHKMVVDSPLGAPDHRRLDL